ncbi:MAG: hypothetical protein AB7O38_18615, partial [Pirellulaceae bacterium]
MRREHAQSRLRQYLQLEVAGPRGKHWRSQCHTSARLVWHWLRQCPQEEWLALCDGSTHKAGSASV